MSLAKRKSLRQRHREHAAALAGQTQAFVWAMSLVAQAGGEVTLDVDTVIKTRMNFERLDLESEPNEATRTVKLRLVTREEGHDGTSYTQCYVGKGQNPE